MSFSIFVYGTLRRGFENEAAKQLHAQAKFCGIAVLRAQLYEVNGYPGAVLSFGDSEQMIGEVFQLNDDEQGLDLIDLLDAYEGISSPAKPSDEYRKETVSVNLLESNQEIEAITYIYQRPTEHLTLIDCGDYVAAL